MLFQATFMPLGSLSILCKGQIANTLIGPRNARQLSSGVDKNKLRMKLIYG